MRSKRAIIVQPGVLRPLPESLRGMNCSCCDKRQSSWEFFDPTKPVGKKGQPICGLCWLYELDWSEEYATDIPLFIADVEETKGLHYKKTDESRLWSCADADDLLGAIVQSSYMFTFGSPRGA